MPATEPAFPDYRIAAIVPCYNEEAAVATVVRDLMAAVPGMDVYVYDNRSSDATAERAREAGAIVRTELLPGKGNVVRRAFADIDADIYLLIDGDDTYDAAAAPEMIRTLLEGPYDHVLGCRVDDPAASRYRRGHAHGNRMFNRLVGALFGQRSTDMLSGYRVFSRRFVKSFPALSTHFEIETELTIHLLGTRTPHAEVPIAFSDRAEGSESKLHTFRDGFRILWFIVRVFALEKPAIFWGLASAVLLMLGALLGLPVVMDYLATGLVDRLPTAVLAASIMVIAVLCASAGVILTGVSRSRREVARLAYLSYPAVRA